MSATLTVVSHTDDISQGLALRASQVSGPECDYIKGDFHGSLAYAGGKMATDAPGKACRKLSG